MRTPRPPNAVPLLRFTSTESDLCPLVSMVTRRREAVRRSRGDQVPPPGVWTFPGSLGSSRPPRSSDEFPPPAPPPPRRVLCTRGLGPTSSASRPR